MAKVTWVVSSHVFTYNFPWKKGRITMDFGVSTERGNLHYTD